MMMMTDEMILKQRECFTFSCFFFFLDRNMVLVLILRNMQIQLILIMQFVFTVSIQTSGKGKDLNVTVDSMKSVNVCAIPLPLPRSVYNMKKGFISSKTPSSEKCAPPFPTNELFSTGSSSNPFHCCQQTC